jgi:hypothetical protein
MSQEWKGKQDGGGLQMNDDEILAVVQRLERHYKLRTVIRVWWERMQTLENLELLPAHGGSEPVKHDAANADARAATDRRIDFHSITFPGIEAAKKEMLEIEEEVSRLADPIERELLTLYYIAGDGIKRNTWPSVAEALYGGSGEAEMQMVFRARREALRNLAKMSVNVSECQ